MGPCEVIRRYKRRLFFVQPRSPRHHKLRRDQLFLKPVVRKISDPINIAIKGVIKPASLNQILDGYRFMVRVQNKNLCDSGRKRMKIKVSGFRVPLVGDLYELVFNDIFVALTSFGWIVVDGQRLAERNGRKYIRLHRPGMCAQAARPNLTRSGKDIELVNIPSRSHRSGPDVRHGQEAIFVYYRRPERHSQRGAEV
jgi:hypothetical protein